VGAQLLASSTTGDVLVAGNLNASPMIFVGHGTTWTAAGGLLAASTDLTGGAFSPADANHLWIAGRASVTPTVWASADRGATWTSHAVPSDGTPPTNASHATVVADPASASAAYALVDGNAPGLYHTTDGGTTWPSSTKIAAPGAHGYGPLGVTADGTLYMLTVDGLFRRAPAATGWTAFDGNLPMAQRGGSSFALLEQTGQALTIARFSQDGTLWISTDGGMTYPAGSYRGLPSLTLTSDARSTSPDDAGVFYASDASRRLWKTTDHGATFSSFAPTVTGQITVLAGGAVLLQGAPDGMDAAIYASADNGATFHAAIGLPADASTLLPGVPNGTAYAPYAGTADTATVGKMFMTTDGGLHWTVTGPFVPSGQVAVVRADPKVAHQLYRLFAATESATASFSFSTDDGMTWTDVVLSASGDLIFWVPWQSADGSFFVYNIQAAAAYKLDVAGRAFHAPTTVPTPAEKFATAGHSVYVLEVTPAATLVEYTSRDDGQTFTSGPHASASFDAYYMLAQVAHRADPTARFVTPTNGVVYMGTVP
jgi:hypothetical protein